MKIKISLLILILILMCSTMVVVLHNNNLLAQPLTSLIIEQLTVHDQTVNGSIPRIVTVSTQNAAHHAWIEPATGDFGSPDSWGVFYRKLPTGSTINLTAMANTAGSPSGLVVQEGENDTACVLWRDEVSGGDAYLYLWNSALNTVTRSPNSVDATYVGGNPPNFLPFSCNDQNDAEILWFPGNSASEITYWDMASNQQKSISNSGGSIQNAQMAKINGVLYVGWAESGNVYLWDSVSETVDELDSSGWAGSLVMHSDKNNVIHMFWLLSGYPAAPCHRYWNSENQVNELLMACDDWEVAVVKDGVGNVHASWEKWSGPTPIEHWNVTENITNTILIQDQSVTNMNLIPGSDGTAHIFWQDDITDDLYYWNSQDKNETFVSALYEHMIQNHVWDFDSAGKIHTSWNDNGDISSDDEVFYWTSGMATPLTISDGANPKIVVDDQGIVHIGFEGDLSRLFYWNSQSGTLIQVSTSNVNIYGGFAGFIVLGGEAHSLIRTGSGDIYYWNSSAGEVFLAEGERPSFIVDGNNAIYLHWVALQGYEAESPEDLFAAWVEPESTLIYLPFVVTD